MMIARVLAIAWAAFLVVWWTWGLFNKKTDRSGAWGRGSWVVRLGLIGAIILITNWVHRSRLYGWLSRHDPTLLHPTPLWQGIGVVLCVVGFAFGIWARLHLGGNWGIPMSMRQDHELVMSGPYAHVRHPIYTGLLLAGLGTVLALGVRWLPVLVLIGVFFVVSARTEEKMLSRRFPESYPDYRKRTRMLIPLVF
jgi:protein-S-isoprenylcysteine O-methyltransferase Ste14